ncbi:carbamoyltransferase HypF [Methylosoma difficile]
MQGVGLRPLVLRLATLYQQHGWIANSQAGVSIAIEGCPAQQQVFLAALPLQLPPFATIKSLTITPQALANYPDFQIRSSQFDGKPSVFVLPDLATCPACVADLRNPASRFYRYPFTSCCHCGPRYSVMQKQPYDRAHTSMAAFALCDACWADYADVANRRLHAQTLACPNCGPQLQLLDAAGQPLAKAEDALTKAVEALRVGQIIAVKGIGGYQLLVDAGNEAAVLRLRDKKHRPQQPFALMVLDLPTAHQLAHITDIEQTALSSAAAPIVLLPRRRATGIANAVAPDSALLGIMLAYSPLHHLLLGDFAAPVVATSGNRHHEPICIDDAEAFTCLAGIADVFLVHNRAIVRPLDDSIVRLINGNITVLRRARGYAPVPISLPEALPESVAVGGQMKSALAINQGAHIILSQHLGDLDTLATQQHLQATRLDLQHFYQTHPKQIQHDLHSGYSSSQMAQTWQGQHHAVQHHYAHALACMAEHSLDAPVLAIVWDGSGLGDDGTLWGGEFLLIQPTGYQRFAHLRTFPLPGGSKAMQEPRRAALGLLCEMFGDGAFERANLPFSAQELALLKTALKRQMNCPQTSSAGRLFDGVASLLGIAQINHYEGQAAMALEASATALATTRQEKAYPFNISDGKPVIIDWQPTLEAVIADIGQQPTAQIAAKFHCTLAEMMLAVARRAGQNTIVLSGGCMQNAFLVAAAVQDLTHAGFTVYCHQQIPPNDGGLAVGQLYAGKFLEMQPDIPYIGDQTPCA